MTKSHKNLSNLLNVFADYLYQQLNVEFDSTKKSELINNFLKENKGIVKQISSEDENKKLKDPAHPKKAKSSYIFFCIEKRDEVKSNNSQMKANDITSELGRLWNELDENDKKVYEEMAEKDKERYSQEMENYVPSAGFEKKEVKQTPKRAPTGYILFCNEKRAEVKAKNPDMKTTDIVVELGAMWKKIPQKKRDEYNEKSQELTAQLKESQEGDETQIEEKVTKKPQRAKSDKVEKKVEKTNKKSTSTKKTSSTKSTSSKSKSVKK